MTCQSQPQEEDLPKMRKWGEPARRLDRVDPQERRRTRLPLPLQPGDQGVDLAAGARLGLLQRLDAGAEGVLPG